MDHDQLLAPARETAKSIKSEADLAELRQKLMRVTIEAALNAELDDHLESTEAPKNNSRNGHSRKRV